MRKRKRKRYTTKETRRKIGEAVSVAARRKVILALKDKPMRKKKPRPVVSHRAKLKPQQVRTIRRAYNQGATQRELAKRFDVSTTCVSFLIRHVTYQRVE